MLQQRQDQYFELSYRHPGSCNTPRQCTTVGFEMGRMCAFVLPDGLGSPEADAETEGEGKRSGLERTW